MSLLKIIRKLKQKEKEMRILILGLDNAGKTTFLKKLIGQDVDTISPTLGFSISTIDYKNYKLNIWDVGGQKSLRPFWKNYFESTDGLIYVVDSSDKMRLQDSKNELRNLLSEEMLDETVLLILANKQDLPGALKHDEIHNILELDTIKSNKWKLFSCSAFNGQSINEALDWLVNQISQHLYDS